MKANDICVDTDSNTCVQSKNFYGKFVAYKEAYPEKKFLLAIGGWSDSGSSKYSNMLANPALRSNFVTEAVKFIQEYNFDGLDLDYEYPAYQWNGEPKPASDKEGFTAWVKELHEAFKPYGWELTAAVSAAQYTIEAGYEVAEISSYLDAIHLMTYDFHGTWETEVNHHAPLYFGSSDGISNADHA